MTVPSASLAKAPALRSGDRVAIVAPASPFDHSTFDRGLREIETLGYEPVVDDRVFARDGFVAGSALLRATHLSDMWAREDIRGILCARGGYGSVQLLAHLAPEVIARTPKVFVGYSDLTTLLSFLLLRCGIVPFHGPMVVGRFSEGPLAYDRHTFLAAVSGAEPLGDLGDFGGETLVAGEAVGPIVGGTLTQVLASLGTPDAFDMPAGSILFIDEVNERPYRLDRMLMQLRLSGLLGKTAALVFGDLPGCDEVSGAPSARETVIRALADFDGPVVWGLPSGHTARASVTLPFGVRARILARGAPRVIIEEAAVS